MISRAEIAYPCSGRSVASVWSTRRSSIPCRISGSAGSLLDMPMEYRALPFECQLLNVELLDIETRWRSLCVVRHQPRHKGIASLCGWSPTVHRGPGLRELVHKAKRSSLHFAR